MRHLNKDGLLPGISAELHEQVVDIIRIEMSGLNSSNELVQLSEVFELQRHMQGSLQVDVRFMAPNSVAATSASGPLRTPAMPNPVPKSGLSTFEVTGGPKARPV